MTFEAGMRQVAIARERAQEAAERASTGKRVVHPGDSPASAGLIVANTVALERYQTIDKAVSRASSEAELVDGTLQNVSSLLARARQLAVQLGSDSYSANERASGAQEIRDISSQMVQLMNTSIAGRYIFGGNVDRTPPFDAVGNYTGDTAIRQVEVAPGLLENSSVRADQMLKGVGGGVDVFATLATLTTALTSDDGAAIRGSLANIELSGDQVSSALTQVGGFMNAFNSARSIGDVARQSLTQVLASESEVDMFEAFSNLTQTQQALEATLSVTAKSFNLGLMDYLR